MKGKQQKSKRLFWRGLTTLAASVLALSLSVSMIIDVFRTDIDKFLGTKSSKIVTVTSENEDLYAYKSDYKSTTELLDSIEDLGERMSEEGSVLLKNNGALPLSGEETKKITLLGFSSYFPVMGGSMGSSLTPNSGTDADTVNLVQAFTSKGYELNPTVKDMYESLKEDIRSESVMPWGQVIPFYMAVAASTTGTYTNMEPSQDMLSSTQPEWKSDLDKYNVMIVTLARGAGENSNYMPGKNGVNPDQNYNQNDPLGLSDKERNLINAAVAAKKANNGKVIVLLNNSSAMEIDEIKNNDGVDAILEIGLPGGYGFYGVADILSGDANPSGKLASTYAVNASNSPAAQNYGNFPYTNPNPDLSINSFLVEAESIYTGYKYYETRYADSVLGQGNADSSVGSSRGDSWDYNNEVSYPFGFGLSYTTFEQSLDSVTVDLENRTVTANVTVTNSGNVPGKEVAQLYVSLPYTEYDKNNLVEKSSIQLLDYEKTGLLQPGESVTLEIVADAQDMTSWDSTITNIKGTKGSFILDNGTYYFALGNGAHDAVENVLGSTGIISKDDANTKVKAWELAKFDSTSFAYSNNGTPLENQLEDADLNYYMPGTVTYLSRNDWENTWPRQYRDLTANSQMLSILDNDIYEIKPQGNPSEVKFSQDNGLTLADLKGVTDINDPRWDMVISQITLEEAMIRTGFGGTSTKPIDSITSPEAVQNDGPNGIYSYPLGQYATKDPESNDPYTVSEDDPNLAYKFGTMGNATIVGQTFSKDMATEYGKAVGNYSLWANLTIHWGAGTNLHRVPYNARNHEYYSEDPVLTAYQAANYVAEGKKYGVIIAPKHFAFNDTEINRSGISVFMTEQKARENELRGTQSVIEDAKALGAMTAFNRTGVTSGNAHEGLLINILRKEWGFKGLMSEDFIRDTNFSVLKEAVISGVTMTCNTGDNTIKAVTDKWDYWNTEDVSKDAKMLQALKNVMLWQNYAIANSNAMDGLSPSSTIISVKTWYDNLLTVLQIVFGIFTVISIFMYIKKNSLKEEK